MGSPTVVDLCMEAFEQSGYTLPRQNSSCLAQICGRYIRHSETTEQEPFSIRINQVDPNIKFSHELCKDGRIEFS